VLHRTETRTKLPQTPWPDPLAAATELKVSERKRSLPKNLLLAALPAADRRRLLTNRDPVDLVESDTLTEVGDVVRDAFFPINSFVSLISPVDGGAQLEVGLVGNEGMVGSSLVLGVRVAPLRALVQGAGLAWKLEAATVSRELARSPALRRVLQRYLYVSLSQIAQTAACTRYHFVEPRLARWLLMTRDRAHSDKFHITHEFLAYMLGVRRVGVTRAASALQRRELIHYTRGRLEVLDVAGLEAAACGCYAAAKATYAGVLG
jgi:CRP-like cAMP-binding protein